MNRYGAYGLVIEAALPLPGLAAGATAEPNTRLVRVALSDKESVVRCFDGDGLTSTLATGDGPVWQRSRRVSSSSSRRWLARSADLPPLVGS